MTEAPQRNWQEIVETSNGNLAFIPEAFIARIEEWKVQRAEFNKRVEEMAAIENEIGNKMQNVLYEMRKFFAENGRTEVWTKDFGIEMNALNDGKFIISITEPRRM